MFDNTTVVCHLVVEPLILGNSTTHHRGREFPFFSGRDPSHGDGGRLLKGWRMVPVAWAHKVRGVASPSPAAWTWLGGGSDSWVADMAQGMAKHPVMREHRCIADSGYRLRRPPRCPTEGYWMPRWSGGGGGINSHDTRHGGPGSYIHS